MAIGIFVGTDGLIQEEVTGVGIGTDLFSFFQDIIKHFIPSIHPLNDILIFSHLWLGWAGTVGLPCILNMCLTRASYHLVVKLQW